MTTTKRVILTMSEGSLILSRSAATPKDLGPARSGSHWPWFFAALTMTTPLCARPAVASAQRAESPPDVKRYFSLVRPVFDGQKAYDQVAFMDQYFRWPGNTGFNASIRRVEETLKAAGYVEQARAKPTDVLTYRIEHRP